MEEAVQRWQQCDNTVTTLQGAHSAHSSGGAQPKGGRVAVHDVTGGAIAVIDRRQGPGPQCSRSSSSTMAPKHKGGAKGQSGASAADLPALRKARDALKAEVTKAKGADQIVKLALEKERALDGNGEAQWALRLVAATELASRFHKEKSLTEKADLASGVMQLVGPSAESVSGLSARSLSGAVLLAKAAFYSPDEVVSIKVADVFKQTGILSAGDDAVLDPASEELLHGAPPVLKHERLNKVRIPLRTTLGLWTDALGKDPATEPIKVR
jgi:hypothetical protein